MTELEEGIIVIIFPEQFERLRAKKGFLSFDAYPNEYKEIARPDEVGRFLFFRFILHSNKG